MARISAARSRCARASFHREGLGASRVRCYGRVMQWLVILIASAVACLPSAKSPRDPNTSYEVGEAVRAQWEVDKQDYAAHITEVTPDGYVVRFDSDGIVQKVDKSLRAPTTPTAPAVAQPEPEKPKGPEYAMGPPYTLAPERPYKKGDAVVGVWRGHGTWYQAHVIDLWRDQMVVQYDHDGDIEALPKEKLRHRTGGSKPFDTGYTIGKPGPFRSGDAVLVLSGGEKYYPIWSEAHVVEVTKRGIRVQHDVGGDFRTVPTSKLQHRIGGRGVYTAPVPEPVAQPVAPAARPVGFMPGEKVTVWYVSHWYDGRVIKIERDGTVVVKFELDGKIDNVTDPESIKHR
jgi:hypothetical protein